MTKVLTRYDILVKSEKDQMNLDFILNSSDKKIIHGTVWDDNFEKPERVPESLVQVFKPGKNYENDPFDIKFIGYVVTDNSGDFVAGPFEAGTMVIFKVFKFWGNNNSSSEYEEASFQTSDDNIKITSEEI